MKLLIIYIFLQPPVTSRICLNTFRVRMVTGQFLLGAIPGDALLLILWIRTLEPGGFQMSITKLSASSHQL
jgi:hypothetical protein